MKKKMLLSVVAVFVAWSVLDMFIHGMFLKAIYESTASLWRPMEEMNMLLMFFVTFLFSAGFVGIYSFLVNPKSLSMGIRFGILFGLTVGISMGFGSYSYMPIPLSLAWSWFAGTLGESIVAGAIVGAILK